MSDVILELARRKYYAEGVDSLLTPFDSLPLERILDYIEEVKRDARLKRKHLRSVDLD